MTNDKKELQEIQDYLETGWGDTIGEMVEYLKRILTWHARLSFLQVEANTVLTSKRGAFRKEHDIDKLKQYQYKDVLDDYCSAEQYQSSWIEGLLKTISKQSEALRTIISYEKDLANLTRNIG